MKIGFITFFTLLIALPCFSQQLNAAINKGNDFYRAKEYDKAAEQYENALRIDAADLHAKFNLAATYFRLDKKVDASRLFDEIAKDAPDATLRSKAYYNNGVILSSEKKLEESVEAYKNALRQNPGDNDARENLQKALLALRKLPPPKKEDNKKKQEQKKQQQQKQSKLSPKEAEQRLKLLEQKEKEVQQRIQNEKTKEAASGNKDW